MPHFVFAKDAVGRFLFVNQAVAEAYGTTVESLRGRTDADFAKSVEEVRHFRADDLEVLHSGKAKLITEETITDAAGKTRVLQTIKIPFTYSGTSVPALLGVAIDITERKRLEQQLLQSQKMEGIGPPRGRDRARLQQPAHGRRGLRADARDADADDRPEAARASASAMRPIAPPRSRTSCSRSRAARSRPPRSST